MKLEGKDCKKFLTKITKMINSINKYNVDSVLLMQIYRNDIKFEPVFMSKPLDIDIFEYLKTIYSDNEIVDRNLKYMDMNKIKKKIDRLYYSPLIFTSVTPIPFMNIDQEDISKDVSNILPMKFSRDSNYSDSYFVITDLLKDFISSKTITAVDDDFRFYDEEKAVYDTSDFIFENHINKTFVDDFIKGISPEHFFPYKNGKTGLQFINKEIQEVLFRLNSSIINIYNERLMVVNRDVGMIENKESIEEILEKTKTEGSFELRDYKDTTMNVYSEFIKFKPTRILFNSLDSTFKVSKDTTVPVRYCGICLQTNDYCMYLFYKIFKYEEM